MVQDIELVIQIQHIDLRLAELDKEIRSLPKQIAEIEKTLESHVRKLEADRAALTANQRERKKLEGDIQGHEQKISKLKSQMSEAKTNEQYRAFQHEISYCEQEIRKLEDRILDLMTESEPLERNVKAAEDSLKQEKIQVESAKKRAQERTIEDRKAMAALHAERKEKAALVTPSVLAQYEKVRHRQKGIGVANATDGTCSACQMTLRPQYYQELRRGDRVLCCEICGSILYYNPPRDIAAEVNAAPAV